MDVLCCTLQSTRIVTQWSASRANVNTYTGMRQSPLYALVAKRSDVLARRLTEAKACIHIRSGEVEVLLHLAVLYDHIDNTRILIKHNIKVNEVNKYGNTHIGCDQVSRVIDNLIALLLRQKANVNAQNKKQATPIMYAVIVSRRL